MQGGRGRGRGGGEGGVAVAYEKGPAYFFPFCFGARLQLSLLNSSAEYGLCSAASYFTLVQNMAKLCLIRTWLATMSRVSCLCKTASPIWHGCCVLLAHMSTDDKCYWYWSHNTVSLTCISACAPCHTERNTALQSLYDAAKEQGRLREIEIEELRGSLKAKESDLSAQKTHQGKADMLRRMAPDLFFLSPSHAGTCTLSLLFPWYQTSALVWSCS